MVLWTKEYKLKRQFQVRHVLNTFSIYERANYSKAQSYLSGKIFPPPIHSNTMGILYEARVREGGPCSAQAPRSAVSSQIKLRNLANKNTFSYIWISDKPQVIFQYKYVPNNVWVILKNYLWFIWNFNIPGSPVFYLATPRILVSAESDPGVQGGAQSLSP